jgi:hypothetical protein
MKFRSQLEARGKNWEFENTLFYLILPNLLTDCEAQVLAKFLNWLKGMKVSRIMKLRLPDSSGRYTHQSIDRNILGLFVVDEFDWVRLDVNLDGIGSQPLWATFLESFRPSQFDTNIGPSADANTVKKQVAFENCMCTHMANSRTIRSLLRHRDRFRCLENVRSFPYIS